MKHPSDNQWAGYVYEDLPAHEHRELEAHLVSCDCCRVRVAQFCRTMRHLDSWRLPEGPLPGKAAVRVFKPLRWAAAAAVVLALGILIGRHGTVSDDELDALRAEFSPSSGALREEALSQMRGEWKAHLQRQWEAFALRMNRHQDELRAVRRDLETVALSANTEFARTKRDVMKLVTLQSTSKPSPNP